MRSLVSYYVYIFDIYSVHIFNATAMYMDNECRVAKFETVVTSTSTLWY